MDSRFNNLADLISKTQSNISNTTVPNKKITNKKLADKSETILSSAQPFIPKSIQHDNSPNYSTQINACSSVSKELDSQILNLNQKFTDLEKQFSNYPQIIRSNTHELIEDFSKNRLPSLLKTEVNNIRDEISIEDVKKLFRSQFHNLQVDSEKKFISIEEQNKKTNQRFNTSINNLEIQQNKFFNNMSSNQNSLSSLNESFEKSLQDIKSLQKQLHSFENIFQDSDNKKSSLYTDLEKKTLNFESYLGDISKKLSQNSIYNESQNIAIRQEFLELKNIVNLSLEKEEQLINAFQKIWPLFSAMQSELYEKMVQYVSNTISSSLSPHLSTLHSSLNQLEEKFAESHGDLSKIVNSLQTKVEQISNSKSLMNHFQSFNDQLILLENKMTTLFSSNDSVIDRIINIENQITPLSDIPNLQFSINTFDDKLDNFIAINEQQQNSLHQNISKIDKLIIPMNQQIEQISTDFMKKNEDLIMKIGISDEKISNISKKFNESINTIQKISSQSNQIQHLSENQKILTSQLNNFISSGNEYTPQNLTNIISKQNQQIDEISDSLQKFKIEHNKFENTLQKFDLKLHSVTQNSPDSMNATNIQSQFDNIIQPLRIQQNEHDVSIKNLTNLYTQNSEKILQLPTDITQEWTQALENQKTEILKKVSNNYIDSINSPSNLKKTSSSEIGMCSTLPITSSIPISESISSQITSNSDPISLNQINSRFEILEQQINHSLVNVNKEKVNNLFYFHDNFSSIFQEKFNNHYHQLEESLRSNSHIKIGEIESILNEHEKNLDIIGKKYKDKENQLGVEDHKHLDDLQKQCVDISNLLVFVGDKVLAETSKRLVLEDNIYESLTRLNVVEKKLSSLKSEVDIEEDFEKEDDEIFTNMDSLHNISWEEFKKSTKN